MNDALVPLVILSGFGALLVAIFVAFHIVGGAIIMLAQAIGRTPRGVMLVILLVVMFGGLALHAAGGN